MKYYQKLATMPTFTYLQAEQLLGKDNFSSKKLDNLIKNKSVKRIRRDLYTCVNFATGDDYATRFQIASNINPDSFISYHSAFEFYGFYNQMFYEIQVCSTKRFSSFSYNDYDYKGFVTSSLTQVNNIQRVRVATIERTIIDSINMLGKVMDAEELVKCLDLIHRVDENKLLEMLSVYDMEILYRKAGYVLSYYKDDFSLSNNFFKTCKEKGITLNKGYLINYEKEFLTFNSEWGLYAYKDLRSLVNKEEREDV